LRTAGRGGKGQPFLSHSFHPHLSPPVQITLSPPFLIPTPSSTLPPLRLSAFDLSLLKLDIRQESFRHTDALDCVTTYLGLGSYAAWDEQQRLAWLTQELRVSFRFLFHDTKKERRV
jgi:hypothetical protein